MADENPISMLQGALLAISRGLLDIESRLTGLRLSLDVLKGYVAIHVSPDAPAEILKQLQELEKRFAAVADTDALRRQQDAEIIDALQHLRKHGNPPPDS